MAKYEEKLAKISTTIDGIKSSCTAVTTKEDYVAKRIALNEEIIGFIFGGNVKHEGSGDNMTISLKTSLGRLPNDSETAALSQKLNDFISWENQFTTKFTNTAGNDMAIDDFTASLPDYDSLCKNASGKNIGNYLFNQMNGNPAVVALPLGPNDLITLKALAARARKRKIITITVVAAAITMVVIGGTLITIKCINDRKKSYVVDGEEFEADDVDPDDVDVVEIDDIDIDALPPEAVEALMAFNDNVRGSYR